MAATGATGLHDQLVQCHSGCRLYHRFNVALLAVTLGFLFAVGLRHVWAAAIGLGMLCRPQVIYVYSYANSDAWALSCSLLLLVFAPAERRPWSPLPKALPLGLLTGLVRLSKMTVWIAIPFAYAVIGYRLWQGWRAAGRVPLRPFILNAAATAVCIVFIAPIMIVYSLSQGGHLRQRLDQGHEARALPPYKLSNPSVPGYGMRSRGAGFDQVVFNGDWLATSATSFYGLFGNLDVPSPQ